MNRPDNRFHEMFDAHHDRLRRFITITLKDEWGADDILQDTFLRANAKLDTLADEAKLGSWLYRIAYRLCIDHLRKEQRHPSEPLSDDQAIDAPEMESSETALARHQMNVCIQNQVLFLPENYRAVVWLFDVLGFSVKETASVLGIRQENVKVRLHRARKKLKAILKQNCTFEKDDRNVLVCEPRDGVDWRGGMGHSQDGVSDRFTSILPTMPSPEKK